VAGISGGTIAGIVVACVVLAGIACVLAVRAARARQHNPLEEPIELEGEVTGQTADGGNSPPPPPPM
jgi:hypothetical protein